MRDHACLFAFTFVASSLAACGGSVVFEDTAGSGGGATVTSTSSSTSAGDECAKLEAELNAKLVAAAACSPALTVVQCSGAVLAPGTCCPTIVNEAQPEAVQAALDAHAAWSNAGCVEPMCPFSCPFSKEGICQPSADGTSGTCDMVFTK